MFTPGFPRLSHPEVAHAIPSVGFIAQVYRRVRLLVSLTTVGVQLTDQQRTAQAPNRFVFEVDNIEAVVASMREAGIKFRNDIISGVGGKQIVAEDPSGNPIEVFQAVDRSESN